MPLCDCCGSRSDSRGTRFSTHPLSMLDLSAYFGPCRRMEKVGGREVGKLLQRVTEYCSKKRAAPKAWRGALPTAALRRRQRQLAVDDEIFQREPVQLRRRLWCKGHLLGTGLAQPAAETEWAATDQCGEVE